MNGLRPAPRVTVITTFLNAEAFIEETIASVLSQSFTDFEYILVDDGSIDESTAIARRYAAEHPGVIRYLEHLDHCNLGMSASRNVGIAAARGDFIAPIDADDIWTPDKLADQIAIMDRHPEVDLVAGAADYWASWEGGQDKIIAAGPVLDRPLPPRMAVPFVYPLGEAPAPCPSVLLLRRVLIERVGGFEESFTGRLQMYEDQAFLIKAYLASSVYFSSRCWLHYRQHSASCVADNIRNGYYYEIRHHFVEWCSHYVRNAGVNDSQISAAVRRARFRYNYPRLIAATYRIRDHMPTWARRVAGRIRRRLLWS